MLIQLAKKSPLLGIFSYAQEHTCARLNPQSALVRSEDNHTDRIGPSGVRDLHMFESVGSASIRREHPKSLRSVFVIDLPAASHFLIGTNPGQYTAIDGFSEHFFSIIGRHNRPAVTINNIASNLSRRHPTEYVSESGADGGRLSRIYFHETSDRSKIRNDGNDPMRDTQLVELNRDARARTAISLNNFHNATLDIGTLRYF